MNAQISRSSEKREILKKKFEISLSFRNVAKCTRESMIEQMHSVCEYGNL